MSIASGLRISWRARRRKGLREDFKNKTRYCVDKKLKYVKINIKISKRKFFQEFKLLNKGKSSR